jgi:putative endonuclease
VLKPFFFSQGEFSMRLGDFLARGFRRLFPTQTLGQRGERAAAKFLKRRGYRILATGDRLKHRDELDIVAAHGRTVVFVEVKTRTSQLKGHPAEAVDAAKQRRLTKLAVNFLKRHCLLDYSARFDVIAITWPEGVRKPQIEHIQNAFDAAGKWEFYT